MSKVKSAETRSHYSYKQRPQTKEWRTNYDSIFRPGLTMEKVQKAAAKKPLTKEVV